ncbi:SCF E3 ubiquitin ligase complex F-box protein grrA [Diplonema papillatum]|nr:SCF E3 ubiquitin ligase complex F-box protein grrA [Diplonema papillatum]
MLSPMSSSSSRRQSSVFQSAFSSKATRSLAEEDVRRKAAKGGRQRILANEKLVSSQVGGSVYQSIKEAAWYSNRAVVQRVLMYLGLHHVFVGQTEDDSARLFQIKKAPFITPTCLVSRAWLRFARELEILDFTGLKYSLTDASLNKAFTSLRSARTIDLSDCRRINFLTTAFVGACRNVQVLHLSGCALLTDVTLSVITMEMPKISQLFLTSCPKLERISIHKHQTPMLEVLNICNCANITDWAVEQAVKDHPLLRELFMAQAEKLISPNIVSTKLELLNVDGCENMSFSAVHRILEQCPALKYVTLSDNDKMLDERIKKFSRFENIVELNISATFHNDWTINSALENMPNLLMLDCSNSEFVTRPAFEHELLEILVSNMCSDLKDDALANLSSKLPRLRHLAVNHCDALIRPQIGHTGLELLDVSNCVNLFSDKTCRNWLDAPNLRSLYIGHTPNLSDTELENITPGLRQLEELNLYQAGALNKPDLCLLQKLRQINVTNCWYLLQEWVDELHLPNLEYAFGIPIKTFK